VTAWILRGYKEQTVSTKAKVVIIIVTISAVLGVLSLSAGDKPTELDEYGSLEIGLGLLFISSPLWSPLVLMVLLIPRRPR
jgi:hypothetical protein